MFWLLLQTQDKRFSHQSNIYRSYNGSSPLNATQPHSPTQEQPSARSPEDPSRTGCNLQPAADGRHLLKTPAGSILVTFLIAVMAAKMHMPTVRANR